MTLRAALHWLPLLAVATFSVPACSDSGGAGGAGGGAGSGGAGGSGGTVAAATCEDNDLAPGAPIQLAVSGDASFSGQMNQVVGAGCLMGKPTDATGAVSYVDATFKAQLVFNWFLPASPDFQGGKTNADLVGKTLLATDVMGGVPTLTAAFADHTSGTTYTASGGSLSVAELDDTHVKGCLKGFTSWKSPEGGTITVREPILFNCRH
jgi:hypothetical protein